MGLFSGKKYWAVILGGSSGIGLATARKLAKEGMNLCIIHRDRRSQLAAFQEEVARMQKEGAEVKTFNLNALQADKQQQILDVLQQEISEGESVRVLVHAISRGNLKRIAPAVEKPVEGEAPHEQLAKSLKGLTHEKAGENGPLLSAEDIGLTIEAMASSLLTWTHLLKNAGLFCSDARVIGLTSEGNQRAWPYYAAVSAAKAALEALARSMARELAPYGIRTNIVQAGITDTPSLRMIPGADALKAHALLRNPMQRLTRPEDVANAIALLCTDEAAWINGAIIPVDGGERLG